MNDELDSFLTYLEDEKKMSENTRLSYKRDLVKLQQYCNGLAIHDARQVSAANLKSYIVYLEAGSFKAATISRNVASIHAFFHYLYNEHIVDTDVSECLQAPKIEKHVPEIMSEEEVKKLLAQPKSVDPKGVRDKAMLELLYATGIRVSELIGLKVSDVDLAKDLLTCKGRVIPFGSNAREALVNYLSESRELLLKGNESDILFPSCLGDPMSRQGFWKLIKAYGKKAGIEMEITPHTLRHSFAAHMMAGGADVHSVSEMLGHSDVYTTQVYASLGQNDLRKVYSGAHPRG
ncbi:MAG: tyrosine recombinase XerD [Lachnospiraceae bacterium]|nr:tyrosine recombinase XerD [Lachnospiraceae bacterium]MBR6909726.1 tyrosine recombinase XerD [Lachnospiraceae bacterium]